MRRILAVLIFLCGALTVKAGTWLSDAAESVIHYDSTNDLNDPVAILQRQLNHGSYKLKFEKKHGYLASLLKALRVPVSSQGLVFSKTSSQSDWTSPRTPRAIYFNENVYVGWTPDAPQIDLISIDPNKGPVFYTLTQKSQRSPEFVRQSDCSRCHQGGRTMFWPGLVAHSAYTAVDGKPLTREVAFGLGHETPIAYRWGGWYVTGALLGLPEHGAHLGNTFTPDPERPEQLMRVLPSDTKGIGSVFESRRYLAASCDIVALLVFEHQTRMHNRLTHANYETRLALAADQAAQTIDGKAISLSGEAQARIEQAGESLLEYMLFSHEAPLQGPVKSAARFVAEFQHGGPRDSRGRSLRELDLKTRMFRYPCSYLVYSPAFDELPRQMKDYLWKRLEEILASSEPVAPYGGLGETDRAAILEILRDTKPEFKEWLRRMARLPGTTCPNSGHRD